MTLITLAISGVTDRWRNCSWRWICSEVERLSDERADVLHLNPAAKSMKKRKKKADSCQTGFRVQFERFPPAFAVMLKDQNVTLVSQTLTLSFAGLSLNLWKTKKTASLRVWNQLLLLKRSAEIQSGVKQNTSAE